jgi:hypothetical protein
MWAGVDEPVGSAQSSPRQLVRMGPCVSNMLRINNNIQKEKKRKHIHIHTHHTEWVMGLYGSIQVLLPYLAGAITLVNLSTQTINACQSLHVSSCDRAVGSSEQTPPLFSFYIWIYSVAARKLFIRIKFKGQTAATHATGDSQRDIRRDPNNKIRHGEKNGLFNVSYICVLL